jgi:hypothetical protein
MIVWSVVSRYFVTDRLCAVPYLYIREQSGLTCRRALMSVVAVPGHVGVGNWLMVTILGASSIGNKLK